MLHSCFGVHPSINTRSSIHFQPRDANGNSIPIEYTQETQLSVMTGAKGTDRSRFRN
jgi:penicillin V acylase-like amidase (Ntn superfamily)